MRVLVCAMFVMLSCGNLVHSPASPITVAWHDKTLLNPVQRIDLVPLEFEVTGCDEFEATLEVSNGPTGKRTALEVVRAGSGWRAEVPVEALRSPMDCSGGPFPHVSAFLSVTCLADARTARSEERGVQVDVSTLYSEFNPGVRSVEGLYSLDDRGSWFAYGQEVQEQWMEVRGDSPGLYAKFGGDVFGLGAPLHSSGGFRAPDGTVVILTLNSMANSVPAAGRGITNVAGIKALLHSPSGDSRLIWLPIRVTSEGLATYALFEAAGGLVLVSNTSLLANSGSEVGTALLVSHLDLTADAHHLVSNVVLTAAMLSSTDQATPRLLGVSTHATSPEIFAEDAHSLSRYSLSLELLGNESYVNSAFRSLFAVSHDGRTWVYGDVQGLWVSSATGSARRLLDFDTTGISSNDVYRSAAFVASGALVAIADGKAFYFANTAEPPAPLSLEAKLRRTPVAASIVPILGGGFAIATLTGLQLFNQRAERVGGAEPLPPECAVAFRPELVAGTGRGQVGIAGRVGRFTFVLP